MIAQRRAFLAIWACAGLARWGTVGLMIASLASLHGPHSVAFALSVASFAHAGQVDALGAPYLGHVNRVMAYAESFRALLDPAADRFAVASVAALHDVVEDSDVTLGDLRRAGLSLSVVDSVSLLTHRPHVPRQEYLEGLLSDPLARLVKLGDTWDNADPVRLAQVPDPGRRARLERKYRDAFVLLGGVDLPGSSPRFGLS